MATSPLPSRGPKNGGICYDTHAFSRVPRRADKTKSGSITPAFSEAPQVGGIATPPLRSRGFLGEATKSKVVTSPLPSRGPTSGPNSYTDLSLAGASLAFAGASGCLEEGTKSEVAT